jgi:hypothetical protein
MPTKSRSSGQFNMPSGNVKSRIQYTNLSFAEIARGTYAAYSRKFGKDETISSETGTDGHFRPVTHSQTLWQANSLGLLQPYQYGGIYATTPVNGSTIKQVWMYGLHYDIHARRYNQFTGGCASYLATLASVQWAALSATALQAMLPTFHGQNSLANFVLELKDFKNVVKYLYGDLHSKISLLQAITGFRRKDSTLKVLSKSYLSYQFGWKPLLNDVVTFVKSIVNFTDHYDELMQRAGSDQQSYWGTWITGTAANEVIYYSNGVGEGPTGGWSPAVFAARCRARVVMESTPGIRYHATVRYRYEMPSVLRSAIGEIKSFLDVLGVAVGNPAVLWNAIPFTFIVDWIVNVSSYLDRLRVDNIDFKTEILDFCHSAKLERTISFQLALENWHEQGVTIPLGFVTTDRCVKTVYERKLGIPNYLTAIQTSGLNPREFSLAGALLATRLKK